MTNLTGTAGRQEERHGVSFREAFWVWLRVAALSFGGPAGQIAVMHRILVEEKRWIGETRFLHALNYCMLLPGPEAQQLAVYIGWLLHRIPGGLVAGTLFILPGYVSLMVLSWLYAAYGEIGFVQALFFGLKAAVLAIVIEAVFKVGKRALKNRVMVGLAALSFIAIFFFHVSFPLIILAAAIIGFVGHATGFKAFSGSLGHGEASSKSEEPAAIDRAFSKQIPGHVRPSWTRAVKVTVICLVLWLGPVVALVYNLGWNNVFSNIGLFFSKMAVITFGGAYAVLAYMAQQAVEYYHWLTPGEMLVGLGFAETTPGPLISVVQFVGFMAAFRHPGVLDPMVAGALGGTLAKWTTFVPCFLWIFLGGPYIEALRGNKTLTASLSAITAAVVGVIFNLAIWFAIHTLFREVEPVRAFLLAFDAPVFPSVDPWALLLSVGAAVAIFWFKVGMIPTLAACCAAGMVLFFSGVLS
jgi:chromate transporter